MTGVRITEDEARDALSQYDLGGVEGVSRIAGGQANRSFHVRAATGRYVLTFCVEKDDGQVEALARLLQLLSKEGFPTSAVVPCASGRLVGRAADRSTLLKTWIDGECPRRASPQIASQLGGLLARLHEVPPPAGLPPEHPYGLAHFESLKEGPDSGFASWLRARGADLGPRLEGCRDRVLLHGDLFPDNVIVSEGAVQGVIDFEEACVDRAGLDLGMALVGLHALADREPGWVNALLEGYAARRPLPAPDLLPAFAQCAAAATAFWRFRQYEVRGRRLSGRATHHEMVAIADALRRDGLAAL